MIFVLEFRAAAFLAVMRTRRDAGELALGVRIDEKASQHLHLLPCQYEALPEISDRWQTLEATKPKIHPQKVLVVPVLVLQNLMPGDVLACPDLPFQTPHLHLNCFGHDANVSRRKILLQNLVGVLSWPQIVDDENTDTEPFRPFDVS
jgi:hypothetical protein